MKSRILNDFAGFAGAAYAVASGVRDEIKHVAKNQINEISARMDLVPRSELDIIERLAVNARHETENLKTQVSAFQKRIAELEERLSQLEKIVTD